ncbi:Aste57867_18021 [Aphanomyces stellatus]|uniref:Aste57867_18021 protein n=1 Tax=Aphanomyces stellatus TaxID=120398 RepID=A0A485LAL5_9STRA|nr:hypothetical protein As57867_017959 [Aphanomyces stellatus]VFT94760.1 Aste57867_18021 [Aphanomyces stellatus]
MVDRRVRREKYNAYMVEYRKKTHENVKTLKETLLQLEAIYRPLVTAKNARIHAILPWKEVARALNEDSALSVSQQRALVNQLREHHGTLQELHAWVNRVTRPLNALQSTWRDVTLPTHPSARSLAMQWITKRMHEHSEAMFQAHHFPPWNAPPEDDIWCDTDVTFSETAIVYVARRHFIDQKTLEDWCADVRGNVLGQLLVGNTTDHPNTLIEAKDNDHTWLHATVTATDESSRVLCTEVARDVDHHTFVFQEILDDEAMPCRRRKQNRSAWFEFIRMPQGMTRVRVLVTFSHSFIDRDAPVDLTQEAMYRGFTLAPCRLVDQEETFRRQFIDQNKAHIAMLTDT